MTNKVETLRINSKIELLLAAANRSIESNEYTHAENHLKQALHLSPDKFTTLLQLSKLYYLKKEFALAEIYLLKTVNVKPDIAGLLSLLGIVRKELGKFSEAEQSYLTAIQVDPNFYEAYYNLGILVFEQSKIDEAAKYFLKAIEINSGVYLAHYNLGNTFRELHNYDSAAQSYKKAIELKPDFDNAHYNLGVVNEKQNKYDLAIQCYDNAVIHNPGNLDAQWNKALLNLQLGNYEDGWREYEIRKKRGIATPENASHPELTNQSVNGKRIFVYSEQGLGDVIQFARYLSLLKEAGAYVIFECKPSLVKLFEAVRDIDILISSVDYRKNKIECDYQVALLSLPQFFKTEIRTIPSKVPYLMPNEEKVIEWGEKINDENYFNIGITWSGAATNVTGKYRSCPLLYFSPLFSIEGVKIFSLQKVDGVEQISSTGLPINYFDHFDSTPFVDSSALIQNLDLVISVDTSIAHLAGALGKPVWTLLPYYSDWRWLLNRNDSPWYPTMRLFKQEKFLDWESVFEKVKNELQDLINQRTISDTKSFGTLSIQSQKKVLYTGLAKGNNFGWGVCSNYLKRELSKKINLMSIDEDENLQNSTAIDGTVLHALVDIDMNSLYKVRGSKNIGYAFFEYELTPLSLQNLKKYDLVLVGSTWNKNKLEQAGIKNVEVLIQGIDPEIFYPSESETDKKFFKIFSGGKFELRKGQDLVLKAIKILQQKYSDIVLVNAWYNFWPAIMSLMGKFGHIKYALIGNNWEEYMLNLYKMNEIDASRILTLPLVSNNKSREIYMYTDIGLFPNRAEGGTNLVLMEYMACGKPVIASYSTGHRDILTDKNSIKLEKMKEYKLFNEQNELIADWEEADINEIISKIEYAYFHREEIKKIGSNAGLDMKQFTWEATGKNLLTLLDRF